MKPTGRTGKHGEDVEVLTVVLLSIQVYRDVMLCHWVHSSPHFEGICCCTFLQSIRNTASHSRASGMYECEKYRRNLKVTIEKT
jgi:hypothetical protein